MKDRIDGLIDDQVTAGSLTGAQADTLKQIFARNAGGGPGDESGDRDEGPVGGVGGRGHRPHGPPPMDASSAESTTGAGASGTEDLLTSFIQQLQATQSSASGYWASGFGGSGQTSTALLFDFQT